MQFDNDSISPDAIAAPHPSSLTRRFIAFVLDGCILGCFSVLCAMIVPVLGAAIAWFFYGPIFESSELRATPGKYLMGVQVTDLMGRRIELRTAVLRNLMKIVSAAFLCLGFLVAFFSEKKQALHDHLADTLVVYGRSDVKLVDAWIASVKSLI